jgi:hypothetical protein
LNITSRLKALNPHTSTTCTQQVDPASLPHGPVTRVDEVFFETRDGCRLSARLWLPAGVDTRRVPAVIEVLPYGVHVGTVDADEATWPYLAGHGIACVRVDSRGAGNSAGTLDDEYSVQQQQDACDAVEWAAAQAWCTGAVGLMGCSWGGFIALQAAALAGAPPAAGAAVAREAPSLRAVCAVCATDDRAADDMGGALLGENLAWGSWLLETLAAPPVSTTSEGGGTASADKAWESRWVTRLQGLKPMHSAWAAQHPTRGGNSAAAYWKEGSVRSGSGGGGGNTIAVPVLSVGGMNGGGYSNSTPRLARDLGADQVTAVMGSWVHNYPHLSQAGPSFGFLAEALAFWQTHLYDTNDAAAPVSAAKPPGVRVHVQRPPLEGAPVTAPDRADGYWIAEESQRCLDEAASAAAMTLEFTPAGALAAPAAGAVRFDAAAAVRLTDTPANPVGVASGRWFTFGDGNDLPGDQRPDDDKSACFDAAPATAETPIIGAPHVRVAVAFDHAAAAPNVGEGVVVARLCAVAPDGVSHRITYGIADVKQQSQHQQGAGAVIDVECNYCAFSLPAGWRLRVAVSRTYWPVVTPDPLQFRQLEIVGGSTTIPALPAGYAARNGLRLVAAAAAIPALEIVAAARNAVVRRGMGVRTEESPRAAGGVTSEAPLVVSRSVDLGVRRLDSQPGGQLTVEGISVDSSALVPAPSGGVSHEQRVERRSVVSGMLPSPADTTAAETEVAASMKVVDGAYHFTTSLEAFVHDGSNATQRRAVFSQRWTEVVPAPSP